MTELEDRRPVAALTTASGRPVWIGAVLSQLLTEHPEIDLTSVRLMPNEDGSVGIAGRVGTRPGVECPQCHTPIGRPHTEYCTLAPDQVWDGVLPALDCHGEGHALEDEVRDCRTCTPGPRLVCRRCNGYGLVGVVAGVNPVPCPDCSL